MNVLPAALDPEASDSESVVTALETAGMLWTKGDQEESIRWLKRAAEYAADAGNDVRALSIARHIADLNAAMSQPRPAISRTPPAMVTDPMDPEPGPFSIPRSSRSPISLETLPTDTTPLHKGPAHPPPRSSREQSPESSRVLPIGAEMTTNPREQQLPHSGELSFEHTSVSRPPVPHRALSVFVRSQPTIGDSMQVLLARPGQEAPPGMEPALLIPLRRGSQLMG